MTLRVPVGVRRGLQRLAAQLGYKPAYLGARLVDEGVRRRHYPQIELRETAGGRVAYVKGTRIGVYWVVQQIRSGQGAERVAQDLNIPTSQVNAALAYAAAFPGEIEFDIDEADANRRWVEEQEMAWRAGHSTKAVKGKSRK